MLFDMMTQWQYSTKIAVNEKSRFIIPIVIAGLARLFDMMTQRHFIMKISANEKVDLDCLFDVNNAALTTIWYCVIHRKRLKMHL